MDIFSFQDITEDRCDPSNTLVVKVACAKAQVTLGFPKLGYIGQTMRTLRLVKFDETNRINS